MSNFINMIWLISIRTNEAEERFCRSMDNYVYSDLLKEDYNTILQGGDIPEQFQQVLADVSAGLNRYKCYQFELV